MDRSALWEELGKEAIDPAAPMPLYLQIAAALREKIRSGRLPRDANLPPEYVLARVLDVSVNTIKSALRELVREGLVYRRPRLGTFIGRPKETPQAFHHVLAVLCHRRLPDQYYSQLLNGLEEGCRDNAFSLHFLQLSDGQPSERLLKAGFDGFILTGLVQPDICRALKEKGAPFIVIGHPARHWPGENRLYRVLSSEENAGKLAVEYLIARGHERISLLDGPLNLPYCRYLKQGVEDACRLHSLSFARRALCADRSAGDTEETGYELAGKALAHKPTALICANDRLVIGALKRIHELELRIPEDISLVGIGNFPIFNFTHPALTSIDTDTFGIGRAAVEFLRRVVEGTARGRILNWNKARVVERESVLSLE